MSKIWNKRLMSKQMTKMISVEAILRKKSVHEAVKHCSYWTNSICCLNSGHKVILLLYENMSGNRILSVLNARLWRERLRRGGEGIWFRFLANVSTWNCQLFSRTAFRKRANAHYQGYTQLAQGPIIAIKVVARLLYALSFRICCICPCMELGFQYLIEISVNHATLAETAKRFNQQRWSRNQDQKKSHQKNIGFRGLVVCACFSRQRFACLLFFLGPRSPAPRTQFKIFAEKDADIDWQLPANHLKEISKSN